MGILDRGSEEGMERGWGPEDRCMRFSFSRGEVLPGGNLEGPVGARPWARGWGSELPRRQKEWSGEIERGLPRGREGFEKTLEVRV